MKAINVMNKANANYVSSEVMKHLKEIEKLLGVSFKNKGGNFDDSSLLLKLEIVPNAVVNKYNNVNPNEIEYAKNLELFDQIGGWNRVDSSNIGKEIEIGGRKMIFIGLSSKRRNASFLGRAENGKLYKIDNEIALKRELGIK